MGMRKKWNARLRVFVKKKSSQGKREATSNDRYAENSAGKHIKTQKKTMDLSRNEFSQEAFFAFYNNVQSAKVI